MDHNFQLPGSYKKWTWGLIVAGLIALLYGLIAFHPFTHPAPYTGSARRPECDALLGNAFAKQRVLVAHRECGDVLYLYHHPRHGRLADRASPRA